MAYKRKRRTTRYAAPKRRRTTARRRVPTRRRSTRRAGKKTIVIQLVAAPGVGGAMSTGTLGKKASSPLLRARF